MTSRSIFCPCCGELMQLVWTDDDDGPYDLWVCCDELCGFETEITLFDYEMMDSEDEAVNDD